jgi:hypothetical protein
LQLTSIINGAPIERKGVPGVALFMRPGESIEDVLKRIALERIALDAPIRARHGLGGGQENAG